MAGLFYSLDDDIGIFFEQYGSIQSSVFYKHIDFGIYHMLNKDLQLDACFGLGRVQDKTDYFFSIGMSYREVFHRARRLRASARAL